MGKIRSEVMSRFSRENTQRRWGPKKRIIDITNANIQNFQDSSLSEQQRKQVHIPSTS